MFVSIFQSLGGIWKNRSRSSCIFRWTSKRLYSLNLRRNNYANGSTLFGQCQLFLSWKITEAICKMLTKVDVILVADWGTRPNTEGDHTISQRFRNALQRQSNLQPFLLSVRCEIGIVSLLERTPRKRWYQILRVK